MTSNDDDKKPLPNGLRFRPVNARGDKELAIMFGEQFRNTPESRKALESVVRGLHGKFVISGRYDRSAFQAESVDFIPDAAPDTIDTTIDAIWCPLVVEALKEYLKHGDPNEPLLYTPKKGALTAQRVLELLLQKDPAVQRFVGDIHTAALRSVRTRLRAKRK
jgi:hypothetical protein